MGTSRASAVAHRASLVAPMAALMISTTPLRAAAIKTVLPVALSPDVSISSSWEVKQSHNGSRRFPSQRRSHAPSESVQIGKLNVACNGSVSHHPPQSATILHLRNTAKKHWHTKWQQRNNTMFMTTLHYASIKCHANSRKSDSIGRHSTHRRQWSRF